ncbi:uncharacterized protein KQ657_003633 [Scheffersomyces spartinae]|uniref:Exonuclease domain-containing protein n=1 Tax=Scheffersomyces spartinae TaxID=45513 RepID=A0A9P7VC15_9ASCO|nr:uncharacterized protein KQ657_003633 [Scheffersomyces spartinae]KAG7195112.1 hypothetical protein KQ657_003633 [Scheffersomyces spartinae]
MRSLLRKSKPLTDPIVWVDCEMTGLDVNNDHIIEICCIITDGDLNVVDENAYESTVYYLKDRLAQMDEWCTTTHTASGLIDKILENEDRSLEVVKNELLGYIKKYVTAPRKAVLAGNSIHMDRYFMMKEMPEVIDWLHYRNIDVSTIMEFGSRHNPELMKLCPKKKQAHTAKDDILESIDQLKWYRKYYFKSGDDTAELVKAMKKGDI